MKYRFVIFLSLQLLIVKSPAQTGWHPQPSGTSRLLRCVAFADSNIGMAGGESGFFRTTNGGSSWTLLRDSLGYSAYPDVYGVCFVDSHKGFAVGGYYGTLWRTTDAGLTWITQPSPIPNALLAVSFANAEVGTAVGAAAILRTTDGGGTWKVQDAGTNEWLYGVAQKDPQIAVAVGSNGIILRTTDGGAHWISQSSGTQAWFSGVSFIDAQIGIAVGQSGTLLRTTDGGSSWINQSTPTGETIINVFLSDYLHGTAVGSTGLILHTTDGGVTWTKQASNTSASLFGVFFRDSLAGTIVGANGTILHTTSGGTTQIHPEPRSESAVPGSFVLEQNYPNPFNPTTRIRFTVPHSAAVTLTVSSILGQLTDVLVSGQLAPGAYSIDWNAEGWPSGVYLCQLRSGSFSQTRKIILLR